VSTATTTSKPEAWRIGRTASALRRFILPHLAGLVVPELQMGLSGEFASMSQMRTVAVRLRFWGNYKTIGSHYDTVPYTSVRLTFQGMRSDAPYVATSAPACPTIQAPGQQESLPAKGGNYAGSPATQRHCFGIIAITGSQHVCLGLTT
jgi:hypothetical protein